MKVNINVIDNGVKCSEADAAFDLKKCLEISIPPDVSGEIDIYTNLTLHGQSPRDVDILVAGSLSNCRYPISNNPTSKFYYINDFCIIVELKEHDHIDPRGTDIYVGYKGGKTKNATQQNEKQKYSFLGYFKNKYDYVPRLGNFVWLKSFTKIQLANALNGNNDIDAFPNIFTFDEMMTLFVSQQDTSLSRQSSETPRFLFDLRTLLNTSRPVPQGLTAKTFNKLIESKVQSSLRNVTFGKDLTVFSGKAGTGKTFFLLQTALNLSSGENSYNCLLLSYNHALVSDIRRLMSFVVDQGNYNKEAIGIKTMYKYFNEILHAIDPQNILTNTDTTETREHKLHDLNNLLESCSEEDFKFLREEWDYILIDEAQDWSDIEINILVQIYGREHIIAADGIDQLIKRGTRQHFGKKKSQVKLGTSLRQESNLVKFVNAYANTVGLCGWKLNDNNAPGGQVVIMSTKDYTDTFHAKIEQECKDDLKGCCYDILFLVPNKMVKKPEREFLYKQAFKDANIYVFDGTNPKLREQYTVNINECRLYNYESCRGLESLITVCLDFDELINDKNNNYVDIEDENLLESPEERRRKYTYLWSLMPITRPVAKLIITLSDPNSEVGRILYDIHTRYSDIVKWEI